MRNLLVTALLIFLLLTPPPARAQKYSGPDGKLRPPTDEGGLSIAALNRMIAGAIRGLQAREKSR